MTALNAHRFCGFDFFGIQQRDHFFDGPNMVS